jgi:hypothetical protein
MKRFMIIIFLFLSMSCSAKNSEQDNNYSNDSQPIETEIESKSSDGASQKNEQRFAMRLASAEKNTESTSTETTSNSEQINKMIIKSANLNIKAEDVDSVHSYVENILKNYQAYSVNSSINQYDNRKNLNMLIRVPMEKFDQLLKKIETFGVKTESKDVSLSDVTEEYIDKKSRLKTKLEVEQQYKTILKQAKTVDDILQVSQKLGEIREEIESTEGRIKYLEHQVSLSTINLSVYQQLPSDIVEQPEDSFMNRVINSVARGWRSLVSLILGVIEAWYLILLLYSAYFIYKKYFRKKK